MAQLRFFESAVSPFIESKQDGELTDSTSTVESRRHHSGDGELNLFEVKLSAGHHALPHVHGADEIIAVVEGELHFGSHVVDAGSSVFIPAYTLYGFRAGPDGCRFLNFRATRNKITMGRQEFSAWRREQQGHREGAVSGQT